MKKLFKKIILANMLMFIICIMSGCGDTVNEKTIAKDMEAEFGNNKIIDKVEIIDRNTEKEKNTDIIYCKVESNDGKIAKVEYYKIEYNLYEEKGWVLTAISETDMYNWTKQPLKGIDEQDIRNAISEKFIWVEHDKYLITKDKIKEISIEKQETDLEALKDRVRVTVILDDGTQELTGELELYSEFGDGWEILDITQYTDFVLK